MGTQYFVGLYYEDKNEAGELKWYRMHYTHAITYEQALNKLLPRLSQWGSIRMGVKWLLMFKDHKGKAMNVINVTKAVEHRWKLIMKKKYPTKCGWCCQMRKGCKIVQILKWRDEPSRGLRNVCSKCRKLLGREIRITALADIKKSAEDAINELKNTGSLNLLTRTIRRDPDSGKVISDTITNHIDGTTQPTPKWKDKNEK